MEQEQSEALNTDRSAGADGEKKKNKKKKNKK